MKIGIIGTGNMGGGLGKLWASKGNQVMFGSRDSQKGRNLASSAGPNACSGTYAEAVQFGEVVLFAVPYRAAEESIKQCGSLAGKILIDCTNPLSKDFTSLAIGFSTSAAEEIAKLAPGAKVVKAFNAIFAQVIHSGNPQFGSQNASIFYCGDDTSAKAKVAGLIQELGFDPVDSGPLKNARFLEPLAGLMINLGYGAGSGTNIAFKLLRR